MNEHVDYQNKENDFGSFTKFFWWCAGADKKILFYSSYSDNVKYQGLGGIVLATGILAAISMFFAINYIFEDIKVSIPVGLLWGAIIFNLDRFIVSSTGKGDGTDVMTGKELKNAAPRLAMAIILGLTISAPLEVYIFQKEIDKQFYKLDQEEQKQEIKKIEEIYTQSPEFNKLNKDKSTLEEETKKLEVEREEYQGLAAKENSTEKGGCGPKCQEFKRMAAEVISRIDERKIKIADINKKLQVYEDDKNAKIKELSTVNNSSHGLLDRLHALHEIPGSATPAWMIRLMFIFIEIAPVLLKLMLIKGPSDYMSDNVNQILMAKQGIDIAHLKDEKDQVHKVIIHHNPKRINEIIDHQNQKETENAKAAIDAFAEKEKGQIKNNPDDFIKPTT
jgi:hypothetical protein